MKRFHVLAWLGLAAAAAALCSSCAPGDAPPVSNASGERPEPKFVPPDLLPERIKVAVAQVRRRELRADHGFWTVFHAILGLGPRTVELTDPTGKRVNAMDYICGGGQVDGMVFQPTEFPEFTDPKTGQPLKGVDVISGMMPRGTLFLSQGHQDQFIAEMVQWDLSPKRKFRIEGKDYEFQDFINNCKMRARVNQKQELSWAIVVLSKHLGTTASWKNRHGETLHFEDLMREEVDTPIEPTTACGGTHRLFGLTWAYHLHLSCGGKTEGVWKKVADKLEDYKAKAKQFRNGDGTFSTNFFLGRENLPDEGKKINTTGHTLEWLALAMTEQELRARWVQDAAYALTRLIFNTREQDMEGASLYHAVHGLLIYYDRLYDGSQLGTMRPTVPLPSNGPPWRKR